MTIRDVAGTVHVIPNGTLDMIANTTKDYSRYVLDVGIAYRENVDEVIGLLRDIDESMQHDPVYSRDILEPIEILGLDRFEESAVIIRARLKTRPLQQWRIGREFNRRLKMVFDERGIEIPFPIAPYSWRCRSRTPSRCYGQPSALSRRHARRTNSDAALAVLYRRTRAYE